MLDRKAKAQKIATIFWYLLLLSPFVAGFADYATSARTDYALIEIYTIVKLMLLFPIILASLVAKEYGKKSEYLSYFSVILSIVGIILSFLAFT